MARRVVLSLAIRNGGRDIGRVEVNNSAAKRNCHCMRAVFCPQLAQDTLYMRFNRTWGGAEHVPYLLIAETASNKTEDLNFARRKRHFREKAVQLLRNFERYKSLTRVNEANGSDDFSVHHLL